MARDTFGVIVNSGKGIIRKEQTGLVTSEIDVVTDVGNCLIQVERLKVTAQAKLLLIFVDHLQVWRQLHPVETAGLGQIAASFFATLFVNPFDFPLKIALKGFILCYPELRVLVFCQLFGHLV